MNTELHYTPTTENVLLQEYTREPEYERILADNPRKTVLLLLQGAVDKGTLARICHDGNSLVEKGFHLGRMTTILDALRDRLHLSQDTPLAFDLEALYQYADKCVQEAVYERNTEHLDSAIEVMTELRDAWYDMLRMTGDVDLH
jgi:flagellar protein FliS